MKPLAEDATARIASVYDAAAATYNRAGPSFFLHFGDRLASVAGIQPGARVLDVATGTGAVLVPAAQFAGGSGRVIGIDLSLGMLARASREIRETGLRNSHVLAAHGGQLPFESGTFDRVLCSFAIFLFPNLARLFDEWHRVLRHAGRLGLVYSAGEDPSWSWYEQLISKYRPSVNLGTERYRPEDVEAALVRGGFDDVGTTIESRRLVFTNAAEFWAWSWSHGDRAVLESLTGSAADFKRELFDEIGKRAGPAGLPYDVVAAVTLGTRGVSRKAG